MSHYGYFYGGGGEALARDASSQANAAASDARKAKSESEGLTDRVERLALMTEALWILLRDRFGMNDEELIEIARDLDLSDGRLDGRVRRVASECAGCRRMVGKQHVKCMYCGTEMPRAPFTGA
jgi:hypothetical protein